MRIVTIYWDQAKDIVTYEWSPEFKNVYRIAKLDVLQDAIADLTKQYNEELSK